MFARRVLGSYALACFVWFRSEDELEIQMQKVVELADD
jgi:hypothetical protein